MSDCSCARQRARSSSFIVSESLFPIRSHGEYYLKVPLQVLVESTSRVTAPHTTPGDTHANLRRLKANLSRLIWSQPAISRSKGLKYDACRLRLDLDMIIVLTGEFVCFRLRPTTTYALRPTYETDCKKFNIVFKNGHDNFTSSHERQVALFC